MSSDRIVVVTGGTGGVGRAVVQTFLHRGDHVVVNYRSPEKFRALQEMVEHKTRLTGFAAELDQEEQVQAFFSHIDQQFGKLDVLLHLAGGFWMGGDLSQTPLRNWQQLLDQNLTATFLVVREAFARMKQQKSGLIVTVAAQAALELPPGLAAYSVSKAGVIALTETLAKEGLAYNVRANVILPSIIDTEANRKSMPGADFSKWITPEEIAEALWLISLPQARGINQTQIRMYGKL